MRNDEQTVMPSAPSCRHETAVEPGRRARLRTVDAMRGLVMVIMALDHTREFFSLAPGDPLDPLQTTPLLFLTRWITHLCAPAFVLLAGTSIFLQEQRRTDHLRRLLLLRGLWLIATEVTLVHLVFNFNWQWNVQVLEVIWVIGCSMILMAALLPLGVRGMIAAGTILICCHNLLDSVQPLAFGRFAWLWQILHVPGIPTGAPGNPPILVVAYPLVPWVGVMAIGYGLGPILLKSAPQQLTVLRWIGASMLAAFALVRWGGWYGDPVPWAHHAVWWRTLASFLNVRKYPPSLLFLLAMLGLLALVMSALISVEQLKLLERPRRVLEVFGRVPFFYFLLHIAVIHLLALLVSAGIGADWRWWLTEFPNGAC